MSLRLHGLKRRRRQEGGAIIEMTPLIDITFQLLIFFLLTATFQNNSSLDVELAQAKNREKSEDQKAILIAISEKGELEIDHKVVDEREFEMRLCKESEEGKKSVNIRADKATRHERLVFAMDVAKRCGFSSLGILHAN